MVSRALNNGGIALQPVPEMVKEFKIENNTYDAAFGLASGTTMNLITESGSNEFHGSSWEYLRNRDLDARNFFAASRPEFIRNQYGGALGGPIRKNKTFFFGSYEGLHHFSDRLRLYRSGEPGFLQHRFNVSETRPDMQWRRFPNRRLMV
jgi:hypothetical protein